METFERVLVGTKALCRAQRGGVCQLNALFEKRLKFFVSKREQGQGSRWTLMKIDMQDGG